MELLLSNEEVQWVRRPLTSDLGAGQRLAAEVIANAIEDYTALVKRGAIVDGDIPLRLLREDGSFIVEPYMEYYHSREVLSLIDFFETKQLDKWLDYAGLKTNAAFIRAKLGIRL